MSYTKTLDVPQSTAAYIGSRPQLRRESDEMEAGLRPRHDFKTVDELIADCLA